MRELTDEKELPDNLASRLLVAAEVRQYCRKSFGAESFEFRAVGVASGADAFVKMAVNGLVGGLNVQFKRNEFF